VNFLSKRRWQYPSSVEVVQVKTIGHFGFAINAHYQQHNTLILLNYSCFRIVIIISKIGPPDYPEATKTAGLRQSRARAIGVGQRLAPSERAERNPPG
jgi:hypothetical protein